MSEFRGLIPSVTESYTDDEIQAAGLAGWVGFIEQYGAWFKMLQNLGSDPITASLCALAATTDPENNACRLAETADALTFAGVRVVGAESLAQNAWGLFQISGVATLTFSDEATPEAVLAGGGVNIDGSSGGKVQGAANSAAGVAGTFAVSHEAENVADATFKASIVKSVYR